MSTQQVQYLLVTAEESGQRLDNYLLRHYRKLPRTLIYRWIRKGEVRVNGKRPKAHSRVQAKDRIRIPPVCTGQAKDPILSSYWQECLKQSILHEDKNVLVINKPSGLAVHGGSGENSGLIENLRAARPDINRLELVHRLDKETSGCLLLAKNRASLLDLHQQLREHKFKKIYHALVVGNWPKSLNKIDASLQKRQSPEQGHYVVVDPKGKPAVTTFQVEQRFGQVTLITAHLHTGRTHQIRVHCKSAGLPILGDSKYATSDSAKALARKLEVNSLCLHAAQLHFTQADGASIAIQAPQDQLWLSLLARLEKDYVPADSI